MGGVAAAKGPTLSIWCAMQLMQRSLSLCRVIAFVTGSVERKKSRPRKGQCCKMSFSPLGVTQTPVRSSSLKIKSHESRKRCKSLRIISLWLAILIIRPSASLAKTKYCSPRARTLKQKMIVVVFWLRLGATTDCRAVVSKTTSLLKKIRRSSTPLWAVRHPTPSD